MRRSAVDIVWLFVLAALAIIVGIILLSGDILLYLAPRMILIVWFGFTVLVALFIYQLFCIVRSDRTAKKENHIRINGLVFLIPIVLMMTVTPDENTSNTLPNRNVETLSIMTESKNETVDKNDSVIDSVEAVEDYIADETEEDSDVESKEAISAEEALPCVLSSNTSAFDSSSDLFSDYLYYSVDEIAGKTVTLYGYVYKEDSFPDNTILVSRLYITCCIPDASTVGFHVKVENADDFEDNEWICVTGYVEKVPLEYYGEYYDFPIITNGTVSRIEVPDPEDAYIYP